MLKDFERINFYDYKELPKITGVYVVTDTYEVILYIGSSKNIHKRWFEGHHKAIECAKNQANFIYYKIYEDWETALSEEKRYIKEYNPKLNKENNNGLQDRCKVILKNFLLESERKTYKDCIPLTLTKGVVQDYVSNLKTKDWEVLCKALEEDDLSGIEGFCNVIDVCLDHHKILRDNFIADKNNKFFITIKNLETEWSYEIELD